MLEIILGTVLPLGECYMVRFLFLTVCILLLASVQAQVEPNYSVVNISSSPSLQDLIINVTRIGGEGNDRISQILSDNRGNLIILGKTTSEDPKTSNAPDYSNSLPNNVNVLRLAPDTFIINLTRHGEINWIIRIPIDFQRPDIVLTHENEIILAAYTSLNISSVASFSNSTLLGDPVFFPYDDGNVVLIKFKRDLTVDWSYIIGGSSLDIFKDIALDFNGDLILVGGTASSDFPLKNATDTINIYEEDGFMMKFSTNGTLYWSTFFGGMFAETFFGVTTDQDNNVYTVGIADNFDFPFKPPREVIEFDQDAFVAKFDSEGNLIWADFIDHDNETDADLQLRAPIFITSSQKLLIPYSRDAIYRLEQLYTYYNMTYFYSEPTEFPKTDQYGFQYFTNIPSMALISLDGTEINRIGYHELVGSTFFSVAEDTEGFLFMGKTSQTIEYCPEFAPFQITDKEGMPIYRSVLDISNGFGECINFIHIYSDAIIFGMSSGKFDSYGYTLDAYLVSIRNPRLVISNRSSNFSSTEVTNDYPRITPLILPLAMLLTRKKTRKLPRPHP
ncbi:MAG: hypothetical protein D6732_11255 [Methanobacteriota archaeon]|nr:MAG: hypothetical protein D6732_11255 [Euryarchaeota archaeon]